MRNSPRAKFTIFMTPNIRFKPVRDKGAYASDEKAAD